GAQEALEIAEIVSNDAARRFTGGVEHVDESRNAIWVRRLTDKITSEWRGEVSGSPSLFALKTVDVVAAGQTIHVIDGSGHKLWESKLAYPIAAQRSFEDSRPP